MIAIFVLSIFILSGLEGVELFGFVLQHGASDWFIGPDPMALGLGFACIGVCLVVNIYLLFGILKIAEYFATRKRS